MLIKEYEISVIFKGQQITKMCCAKNVNEAAMLLNVNTYFINKYGYKNKIENPYKGVMAYFDSGKLWEKEKNLIRVKMPLEKIINLIEKHKNVSN